MAELPTFLIDGQDVPMPALRAYLTRLSDTASSALLSSIDGAKPYATLALAQAAPVTTAGRQARVYADPDATKNGVYVNVSGAVGGYAVDTAFYNQLSLVVQPLVTAAANSAAAAAASAAAATGAAAPIAGLSQAISAVASEITTNVDQFDVHDLDGRKLLAFSASGDLVDSDLFVRGVSVAADIDNTKAAISRLPRLAGVPRLPSGYAGISGAGQSNMSGNNEGAITLAQDFSNKRSVNTTGAGALIPLVESGQETSLSGAAAQASDLLLRRIPQWAPAYQIDWVANNMGGGGLAYSQIKKGTSPYSSGLARVAAAKARATAEGKSYVEAALVLHHGEQDAFNGVDRPTYKGYLKELRTDWQTDTRAAIGQAFNQPMLITQVSLGSSSTGTNSGPTLAMLDAAEEESDIFVIAPGYMFTFTTDGLHLNNHDQRMLGAIEGKMIDRYYQDGKSPSTVRPIGLTVIDKRTFIIDFFVPVAPLRWNIDWVWPGDAGLGFAVYNTSTGAELAMACSPQIVGPRSVCIRMAADLPAGWRYTYAIKAYSQGITGGVGAGRRKGPRGCLCDSDRTSSYYADAKGRPYVIPNFCAIFDKPGA